MMRVVEAMLKTTPNDLEVGVVVAKRRRMQ